MLIIAAALALTGASVTPAVAAPTAAVAAAAGIAGPYGTPTTCKQGQAKYVKAGYKVGACFKDKGGLYFKYSK